VPVNTEVGKEDFTAPQSNDQEGIMGVHGVSDRANPSEVNMNEEHARCDGTRADERRSSGCSLLQNKQCDNVYCPNADV